MRNILFLTTMYPDPMRPGTKVCHYFTSEWAKMGYNVLVINMRSMFPRFFTDMARLFPGLAQRYVGNHVEMDRNMNVVQHEVDGIPVYSIPVFKYIPHRKYPSWSIRKCVRTITGIVASREFVPDAVVGHFFNPTMEVVYELGKIYDSAKTCIVFHEGGPSVVVKNYGSSAKEILASFDLVGFRHNGMRSLYETQFGHFRKSFICYSGTNALFLESTPPEKGFSDAPVSRFLYVGQFTANKRVIDVAQAVSEVSTGDYRMTLVGGGGTEEPHLREFISDNGLDEHFVFTGRIDRNEVIKYYDENQCFIMVSRSEAFGLVYLEAMSRGCICIGSIGQGIDGVIIDGVNGFLCHSGNVEELKAKIAYINSLSSEEKRTIASNARKTAESLSDKNVAQMYIDEVEKA